MPRITNVKMLRKEFWKAHPHLPKKKIPDYTGNGKMHNTDTRCAWTDYKDMLSKSGDISQDLANATL